MERFIVIGEVVKAVGLKGEFKLYPLLDFHPDLLDSRYLVWADGSPVEVLRHRPASGGEAVKVAGIEDRNAAEEIVGRELGFMSGSYLAEDFPRPAGGLPFRYLDREVATTAGETVGTVVEVRFTGGGFTLVVAVPGKEGEILIPAVEPILRPDDGLTGTLVVDPPEGLLDVQTG